jgi:hypothetical protein
VITFFFFRFAHNLNPAFCVLAFALATESRASGAEATKDNLLTSPVTVPKQDPPPTQHIEDPLEAKRRMEMQKIFEIQNENRPETPTPEHLDIEFGALLGLEFDAGMGMRSRYTHDEDVFEVKQADPLLGCEVFAQKSIALRLGFKSVDVMNQQKLYLDARLGLSLFQGNVNVEQTGIQQRKALVTHRIFRAYVSTMVQKNFGARLHGGAGIGLGLASLNQIGLGVSDSFFASSYFPLVELQLTYALFPDVSLIGGVRKIGFTQKPTNSTTAAAATLGASVAF